MIVVRRDKVDKGEMEETCVVDVVVCVVVERVHEEELPNPSQSPICRIDLLR